MSSLYTGSLFSVLYHSRLKFGGIKKEIDVELGKKESLVCIAKSHEDRRVKSRARDVGLPT